MTGVKLTERIRYMHCRDVNGDHGVLVLLGNSRYQTKAVDIECQADFKFWYSSFRSTEERQAKAIRPRQLATA